MANYLPAQTLNDTGLALFGAVLYSVGHILTQVDKHKKSGDNE